MGLEAFAHATIACAKALRDEDLRREVSDIRVPTLVLHGKHDEIYDVSFFEILNEKTPQNTLISFENSGHGLV
ncbi:hypothetical protein SAMN05192559_106259 [Halobacillus karajensis]|uniref:3-oxoadipate enol-lactonase n=1 Tax=Halobacillus karajensis TaxID=195088 RepID=A0A024P7R6_9BACI|nr:alpha/beta hydrolase [Halobacillus karajensis]CDQ20941.1 3-oxoadipate enol-lactonase [Halobacillus karajensis]CDQ24995.1 3-oxoadipate enol-lactonase [Halobacillus karajensis]CDQ28644.1 3-oxoadipate enol-lactonase [Halobacillus karajensis]SEH98301.1 hypothetical protein SAMN05192559_106259 [Halobacillus karajensis]